MKNKNKLYFLLVSQNLILFGSGLVFPYYVIFIRDIGADFTQFGLAYALFAISASIVHLATGQLLLRLKSSLFIGVSSWGTALALLFFPIVTNLWHVYLLQIIMGAFSAAMKTGEKYLVADLTDKGSRAKQIGNYHAWITLFSGLAVIVAGFLIDIFSLDIIFYIGSIIMFIGGMLSLKINK